MLNKSGNSGHVKSKYLKLTKDPNCLIYILLPMSLASTSNIHCQIKCDEDFAQYFLLIVSFISLTFFILTHFELIVYIMLGKGTTSFFTYRHPVFLVPCVAKSEWSWLSKIIRFMSLSLLCSIPLVYVFIFMLGAHCLLWLCSIFLIKKHEFYPLSGSQLCHSKETCIT